MKRVLVFFLCLSLLFPSLAAPALAAEVEPEEYVFYLRPDIEYYDDTFPFFPDHEDVSYFYDGLLPEGDYVVKLLVSGTDVFLVSSLVSVSYSDPPDDEWELEAYSIFSGTFVYPDTEVEGVISVPFDIEIGVISGPVTLLNFCVDGSSIPDNTVSDMLVFVPVAENDVDISVSDVVTPEMVSGVLDNVISVIPVVVGALAIYVGFRKGLAWLDNLIHGV